MCIEITVENFPEKAFSLSSFVPTTSLNGKKLDRASNISRAVMLLRMNDDGDDLTKHFVIFADILVTIEHTCDDVFPHTYN